jgi:hypothetical protein
MSTLQFNPTRAAVYRQQSHTLTCEAGSQMRCHNRNVQSHTTRQAYCTLATSFHLTYDAACHTLERGRHRQQQFPLRLQC